MQLDIYGEVVEAVSHFIGENEKLDRDTQKMLRQCAEYVCEHWREPDNGIWEYRDKQRHYTHSRLMCWVALDRILNMQMRGQLRGIDVAKCEAERLRIRQEIELHAWNPKVQAYVQASGSDVADASALLLAYHGFEEASSDRMQRTYQRIRERLVPRTGLVYRNERSLQLREGAFALCSFWEVDFLARAGKLAEGYEIFETTLSYANDVDLFARGPLAKSTRQRDGLAHREPGRVRISARLFHHSVDEEVAVLVDRDRDLRIEQVTALETLGDVVLERADRHAPHLDLAEHGEGQGSRVGEAHLFALKILFTQDPNGNHVAGTQLV